MRQYTDSLISQMEVDSLRLHKLNDYHKEEYTEVIDKVSMLNDTIEPLIKTYILENSNISSMADVYVSMELGKPAGVISIVDPTNENTDFIDAEIEIVLGDDLELSLRFVEFQDVDYERINKTTRHAEQYFNLDHNDWRFVRNLMQINKVYLEKSDHE